MMNQGLPLSDLTKYLYGFSRKFPFIHSFCRSLVAILFLQFTIYVFFFFTIHDSLTTIHCLYFTMP